MFGLIYGGVGELVWFIELLLFVDFVIEFIGIVGGDL